jgi:hypothetical protein
MIWPVSSITQTAGFFLRDIKSAASFDPRTPKVVIEAGRLAQQSPNTAGRNYITVCKIAHTLAFIVALDGATIISTKERSGQLEQNNSRSVSF